MNKAKIINLVGVLLVILIGGFVLLTSTSVGDRVRRTVFPNTIKEANVTEVDVGAISLAEVPQEVRDLVEYVEDFKFFEMFLDVVNVNFNVENNALSYAVIIPTPPDGIGEDYLNAMFERALENIFMGACKYGGPTKPDTYIALGRTEELYAPLPGTRNQAYVARVYAFPTIAKVNSNVMTTFCAGNMSFESFLDYVMPSQGLGYLRANVYKPDFFVYIGKQQ